MAQRFLVILLWAISLSFIVFNVTRHETTALLSAYALAFAVYLFILIKQKMKKNCVFISTWQFY